MSFRSQVLFDSVFYWQEIILKYAWARLELVKMCLEVKGCDVWAIIGPAVRSPENIIKTKWQHTDIISSYP